MTVSAQENSEQIRVPATVAEEADFFRNPCVVPEKYQVSQYGNIMLW
ncbi:MAG: hypothetical protein Q7T96_02345 [Methylobacter sp.]|nr:hypothetical protein [Methylobacter sp.]